MRKCHRSAVRQLPVEKKCIERNEIRKLNSKASFKIPQLFCKVYFSIDRRGVLSRKKITKYKKREECAFETQTQTHTRTYTHVCNFLFMFGEYTRSVSTIRRLFTDREPTINKICKKGDGREKDRIIEDV